MKKILIPIFSVLLIAVTGCSSLIMEDPLNYISTSEALEKLDNEETFALFVCEKNKAVCVQMLSEFDKLKNKDGIVYDYIDLGEIDTEKEYDEIDKIATEEYLNLDLEFMPKMVYISKGKRVHLTEGTNIYAEMLNDYNKHIKK